MKLISIGAGNFISASRVIAVAMPDSAPVRRAVQEARNSSMHIDATSGRKTGAVIFCDSGHIVTSYFSPEDISSLINNEKGGDAI